ncbi:hypothetical protein Q7P37_011500 [Cladosporium fusiforme]
MNSPSTPVVIGVGDFINRSKRIEDAVEPLQLMLNAIEEAFQDTGLDTASLRRLRAAVQSLDVVRTWTWPYPDLPGLIAERLYIDPKRKHYTPHGGNQPGVVFDEAARRIAQGETKVALLTGGEALASLSTCAAKKQLPPPGWTFLTESVNDVFSPTTRELKPGALPGAWTPSPSDENLADLGSKHRIGNPIHIYPLYENGFRAFRGQSPAANNQESAMMYAEFAKVAAANKYAWNYGAPAQSAEEIGTPSKRNRMICHPYPLLMNAFNNINLAAACVLTSTDFARELGVPEEKWIYPLGGAGTQDSDEFWHRPNFHSSPSISRSLSAALEASNLSKEGIDIYDFYSCFPIVPKLACHHLSLPAINPPKPITVLGGLTSFGGAGNNYSMHALTEMTRQLRRKRAAGITTNGLVLANGGVVTYQHVVCLSTSPRKDNTPYPAANPLPPTLSVPERVEIEAEAKGDAVIETYTVEYARDNTPLRGYVVGRLVANNRRFLANHADELTLRALSSLAEEQVGRSGSVWTVEGGRNVFALEKGGVRL